MSHEVAQLDDYLASRGLRTPAQLAELFVTNVRERLGDLLYRPTEDASAPPSMAWAEALTDDSDWPLLPNLVPLLPVDERSFACVVASNAGEGESLPGEGAVVRWHLDVEREDQQAEVLDTDCLQYAASVADELEAREAGLRRMFEEIGPAYHETHLAKEKRPRDYVVRPIRIACQNVIVALAAIAQEASFDGLSVVAWQTCEVPHVAAHEANRALTVITLCDAFKNGGTMEIRFDRDARVAVGKRQQTFRGHPEGKVPASLRRFARTVGVEVGSEDPAAISPAEARVLFEAVTPMPDELHARFDEAVSQYGITPERLCFSLCTPIWRQIELDWLLATTPRVKSILEGGAPWTDRSSRQAETEACRAAVMAGMLLRRLDATDAAGASGAARLVEDRRNGVHWSINPEIGAIRFTNLPTDKPLPWTTRQVIPKTGELLVACRSMATPPIVEALSERRREAISALVLPRGIAEPESLPEEVLLLRCPDRLADIDKTIDANLTTARISRA